MDASLTDRASIRIEPDTGHVAAVRSFVGALGRQHGCADEDIEDLRLAVSEACAQALEEGIADAGIVVRAARDGPRLIVEVSPCGRFHGSDRPLADAPATGAQRRALISALFPDAGFAERAGAPVLRLAITVPTYVDD